MATYKGIDVSNWQGEIDFARVRQAGIEIVFIKATEGTGYIDPFLKRYYDGAREQDLRVGFYHYLTSRTADESREQARYFVNTLGRMETDCIFAVDLGNKKGLDDDSFSELARIFIEELKAITDIDCMIYASTSTAKYDLSRSLSEYPLWVAEYGVTQPRPNGKWTEWAGWQYSNTGRISGIRGNVDLDIFRESVLLDRRSVSGSGDTRPIHTSRAIYYTVRRGDTLSKIAARFGTTVSSIVNTNLLRNPNMIRVGQILKIYTDQAPSEQGGDFLYHVRRGDTLGRIAARFHTTVDAILSMNDIRDRNLIYPGQMLRIPREDGSSNLRANPSDLLDGAYVVQRGDTLSSIGSYFGEPYYHIAARNGISNQDCIYPGQILKIYESGVPEDAGRFTGAVVVQRCDNLRKLSRRYMRSMESISQDNGLIGCKLCEGMVINLPADKK